MEQVNQRTYVVYIRDNKENTILNMAKESANVYNQALSIFWDFFDDNQFLSMFDVQKHVDFPRTLLHSDSYLAALQQAYKAICSFLASKKSYEKNPEKFNGKPMPPREDKETFAIFFKKSAIRVKNKKLLLSTGDRKKPLSFRWNAKLGTPKYAVISWKRETGWQLSMVLEKKNKTVVSQIEENIMAIDLGVKRIAATYDQENTVLYSGKVILSLMRLRSKINGETQQKLKKLKKHSRKYKRIKRANRRVVLRINNKLQDILHKTSRTIVNDAVGKNITKIVAGDCSGIHDSPNLGRINNQKVVQCPEQRLLRYIGDKFEVIGGIVETIPENYTSRTCPSCGNVKKSSPSGREYRCSACKFRYDRDGIGAINIFKKVSFGCDWQSQSLPDVVGSLTLPIGWKYNSSQDCLVHSG